MPGTHGELFSEIGQLVVAADAGSTIDLTAASEDLADRYDNLGLPAPMLAKAIARSLGAIGVSMMLVGPTGGRGEPSQVRYSSLSRRAPLEDSWADDVGPEALDDAAQTPSASVLLPSGVRLAVLS